MGREKALFCLIQVNDDKLKLAVVCCLFTVPPDELDIEELNSIVEIVATCINVGAGDTEIIIAVVHWIFYKLTEVDYQYIDRDQYRSSKLFQQQKGAEALALSLKILDMNLDETRADEGDDEKYPLAMSILNFWKVASRA